MISSPISQGAPPSLESAHSVAARHLGFLDGLRALTALYVVIDHAVLEVWPQTDESPPLVGAATVLAKVFGYGHFAVSVFIVLSGFCLMLPIVRDRGHLRGGVLQFFRKRAKRILPPYYFAILLSLVLIWTLVGDKTGTHWDVSIPVTPRGIVLHLLLLQDVVGAPQINHVFWSISVEWQIYFAFPLVVFSWRRFGGAPTAIAAAALSCAGLFALRHHHDNNINPQYLGLFVTGMAGAELAYSQRIDWQTWSASIPWRAVAVAGAAGAIALTFGGKFGMPTTSSGWRRPQRWSPCRGPRTVSVCGCRAGR